MQLFTSFSLLAVASFASAHGIVTDISSGNDWWTLSNPFRDPYMNPVPDRVGWSFFGAGNGPVPDFTTKDIVCNQFAKPGKLSATIAAGSDLTFYWTVWPESHKGPVLTYLANCNGDCSQVQDPSTLSYFKIDHAGLEDGVWVSDKIIANNNSWTVKIPSDIAPGNYLVRHELLALHSAGQDLGAQFYPVCINFKITGSGNAKPAGVTFPGAYKRTDPGILVNIYNGIKSYIIPGPAPYVEGGSPGNSAEPQPQPTSTAVSTAKTASTSPLTTSVTITSQAPSNTANPPQSITTTTTPKPQSTNINPTSLKTVTTSLRREQLINLCLDDINRQIAAAQPKNGGPIDFSNIEKKREDCYKI
ncbi:hypothetical protein DV495_001900 [Geotrichum candidum]|nr:hypothetical protein DV495_001900 [Geotrichum candidum]